MSIIFDITLSHLKIYMMKTPVATKRATSKVAISNPNPKVAVSCVTKKLVKKAMLQYSNEYGRAMSKLAHE